MKGYVYITSVDPGQGIYLNDPIFEGTPTLGACMPNVREKVEKGDYIFTISGKTTGVDQYVIGGFEVESKLSALAARKRFPENILHIDKAGIRRGNIIVNADGTKHPDDTHRIETFERRIQNYVIGRNPINIAEEEQVKLARMETLGFLKSTFGKDGTIVRDIIGRCKKMDANQVNDMITWLKSIKRAS